MDLALRTLIMALRIEAIEDIPIMRSLPNLKILNPCDNLSASFSVKEAYKSKQPVYIN